MNNRNSFFLNLLSFVAIIVKQEAGPVVVIFSPAKIPLCARNLWPATHGEESLNLDFPRRCLSSSANLQSGTFHGPGPHSPTNRADFIFINWSPFSFGAFDCRTRDAALFLLFAGTVPLTHSSAQTEAKKFIKTQ